jgi:hypothetical protein
MDPSANLATFPRPRFNCHGDFEIQDLPMAYVPGFSNDIFISYSHLDELTPDNGPGWVSGFHRHLLVHVEQELGANVKIWRDPRLTGATDFTKELEKQVRGSAMLVAIVSPGYINSKWCDWELSGFAGSRRVGDLWVDTKCRAIKILRHPEDEHRLRVLPETEGMKFFDIDPTSDLVLEIEPASKLFKRQIASLVHDIGFVLREMRKARTVFIGTASQTLSDQRERVQQELIGRDYRILTAADALPNDHRLSARSSIAESALSILFYDRAAAPAEQQTEALAALEREIAMEQRARQIVVVRGQPAATLHPWDEPGATEETSAKVEWLIEPQIHTLYHTALQMLNAPDAAISPAPDVLPSIVPEEQPADPLERAPTTTLPPSPQKLVRIYLVCDQKDHPLLESNRARSLRDYLLQLGFEVKLPLAEHDDHAQFSRDNRTKLTQCDAVLVYWGCARQAWFDQRLGELMQARGWRQGRAFTALGAYVADPKSPVKHNYETLEVDELIKQFEDFDLSDARLVRFVERLGHTP